MKFIYIYIMVAVIAGALLPVQAGLNAKMGKVVNDPIYAALISFIVGSLGLLVYGLLVKMEFSQISNTGSLHWTVWGAGLLGAFYVSAIIILVPKIGTALTFGLIVTGQLGISLALDHFGWLGLPVHAINWQRIIGIVCIVAGVLLIRNF